MAENDFSAESPENFDQKCLCVLVLDVSGSMRGAPIEQLNRGLQIFYEDIKNEPTTASQLEICIVTFGSRIEKILEPALVDNFDLPRLEARSESTKLADGVFEAVDLVHARKKWYKETGQPYYRPWVILMTDGYPDRDQDIDGLADYIHQGTENRNFIFFAIGVKGADMEVLARISNPDMPPASLEGLRFSEFFRWLSASMAIVTSSQEGDKVNFPDPSDWMKGFSI